MSSAEKDAATRSSSDSDNAEKGEVVVEKPQAAQQALHLQLDTGDEYVRFRRKWWQLWLPKDPPPPPPPTLEDAKMTPLASANIFSILSYWWITDMMILGYQRTLQASDLYKMDPSRESGLLSEKLEASWSRRVTAAEEWNARLEAGEISPSAFKRLYWSLKALRGSKAQAGSSYAERRAALQDHWRTKAGRKEASLAWALNDVFGRTFWSAGVFKVLGDTSQLMSPIILRTLITFSEERAAAVESGTPLPNIGRGVGMAIGLFLLVVMNSCCTHQFFWRSMTTGVLARAALIAAIYKRGTHLTGKARIALTNATLMNHISSDVSRVDACAQWFHAAWTAPIQVTVCLIILLVELGPSALAGFALFLIIVPLQERAMTLQQRTRQGSMKWTDMRSNVLMEVLGAMRVVKYFSYEIPFLTRIGELRKKELVGIRRILHGTSANLAFAMSLPVLAATLAFVTYTSTTGQFNVAAIFSSLSLFQLLRQPMMFMPRALAAIPDASNALKRLARVFHAELRSEDALVIDEKQEKALIVENATFEWETELKGDEEESPKKGKGGHKKQKAKAAAVPVVVPVDKAALFKVKDINMIVARGQLVAVVGPVGSGKSSLLQGLIGEMRRVSGSVSFGGRVGYCPQTAWIQNSSLRDNIIFGQPFDEDKYWRVIETACLLPDLQLLPDGDLTEIGEKGINLSGGQKQRINIARALYFDPEVVIFDDPLSAVDAHVGKSLFQNAIIGSLRNRGVAVILVTHALHFLSQCDYIYTMSSGTITEGGTYADLIAMAGDFARLDKEFGGHSTEEKTEDDVEESQVPQTDVTIDDAKKKAANARQKASGSGKLEGRLMVREKRSTGSVSTDVYKSYLKAGKGWITAPIVVLLIFAMQGSQILNSYTLVWWEANTFDKPNSFYQIIYAFLGIAQALSMFLLGIAMDYMSYYVSRNLHHEAVRNIFYAPMSFFDTTPMGRIMSIFGKDIDSVDNQLALAMRIFILTISSVIGSIVIVTILEYYFIIAVIVLLFAFQYFAGFYRSSAREVKRLDSMLRSVLYAHFSETFTGLPTIRSYGAMSRFVKDNKYYIDLEDRALFLVVTNQRWLAVRLDFMGGLLVLVVAMLSATDIAGINPAQIGLVLTYSTSLAQMSGIVARSSADVENYMNSVERVSEYSRGDLIAQEPPHEIPEKKPPAEWPQEGKIVFSDVKMAYRKGLPDVLRGVSIDVKAAEKIGVVGRTGAGKSSLMLALFRIVELNAGFITIDGIDISTIGLKDLRTKISIIPQDPLLFSGTIRSNLDPFSLYDDAHLWDALRRSYLIEDQTKKAKELSEDGGSGNQTPVNRYTLDSVIENEGNNLSVGERSLLSLARALVKDAKVVVLDEATASVDLETDAKIQRTIQTEFADRTLLCIAHRLRTIISYDRILVLDQGQVAEFDTPLNLFRRQDGIFRGMCERSNISEKDIEGSVQAFD
ncbi:ABC protein [Coniophora puteana RWD-64-598 SS2]|uniref:ABC protein n=1 Tax=Coniophora puteana (strain RWD-64-598) TaxID=741705 RepID=A0A5M3MY35_CONPW|nr:ABC protein [Coniophora puteana RWD-64-598 SS2]EIW84009.1 ABC protein [Coniophora puteana RWD-64-598 SS2]